MSTPSADLPPNPAASQAVGQQTAPSTVVPHTPNLVAREHNGLATVSLVTGILSFLGHVIPIVGGSTLAIVAIITGFIARNQIKQTGEDGMTAATVGIVLGIANLALVVVVIVLILLLIMGVSILGIALHH